MVAATALLEPGSRVRVRFGAGTRPPGAELALRHWLESQLAGAERAAAMIRPFADGEFGRGAEAPSPAHLAAANRLLGGLRRLLREGVTAEREAVAAALADPSPAHLDRVGRLEESYAATVAASEKVWQFYRDIFGQRQTRIAPRLLACDRIGLDCYQAVYQGLGKARSIPAPAPFAYMESGRGPATYRRDILLSKIARLPNPFPLIKLPYHRLVAPWTLGAVPHEIGHNLQSDLDLWREIPGRIPEDLRRAGISTEVARIWARWHKEM
ncbi:MAG TPA: hypothetical protein ENK19_02280, partial [Acidobacteria bacterium]|nr:hypothetical protein [Acidobacteriota bacterium]